MRIVSVKRPRGTRTRVHVELSDGSTLELAAEVALRAGVRKDAEVTPSDLDVLRRDDVAWRCKEAALRLLSYRPRAERELRRRLAAKGFPPEPIDGCLADLARAGLVDDEGFARALARDRIRGKPVGRMRLRAELRARGVEDETAAAAIDETFAGESGGEVELARRAAARFRPRSGEDRAASRRRLYGFLARRGFPAETVGRIVDEVLPRDDEETFD